MADANLTQAEADALLAMEKRRVNEHVDYLPQPGGRLRVPLQSVDRRERFWLDVHKGRIALEKVTLQNRAREVVVLVRLDIAGSPHRNPDGEELPGTHLHVFREGQGYKFAIPVPAAQFRDLQDLSAALASFLAYCNVTEPPRIEPRLEL